MIGTLKGFKTRGVLCEEEMSLKTAAMMLTAVLLTQCCSNSGVDPLLGNRSMQKLLEKNMKLRQAE